MNCKENIIKAAVQIISNNGLNFSMDELASKLKMSKRTVYEQVSSKENLVIECMESLKLKFDAYYEEVYEALWERCYKLAEEEFKNE
jgi:AcrR family transcriptional regulator